HIVTATPNPMCTGAQATLVATPFLGGASPVYQWKVNGANVSGNNATLNYAAMNGDVITCQMTSSHTCVSPQSVTSTGIGMRTFLHVTPSITIMANPGTSVPFGQLVTFTTRINNGGTGTLMAWYRNQTFAGNNPALGLTAV